MRREIHFITFRQARPAFLVRKDRAFESQLPMIGTELQLLATRYVLGECEAEETARFREELTRNGELRQFVAQLQDTIASLSLSTPPRRPAPELLARILNRVRLDAPKDGQSD